MSETIYRVAAKHAVLGKHGVTVYKSGDIVPVEKLYSDQPGRLKELLAAGVLTTDAVVVQEREGAKEVSVPVGKWRVNPRDTAGKSLEDLHVMILEIDVSIHTNMPETIEEARQFLSIDYYPDPDPED